MLRLLLPVILAGATTLSALTIDDAYPRYMEADLFKTVTEYLTGEEREGKRLILRTQPSERSGQYFIITVDPDLRDLPEDATAVLEVIPSDAKTTEVYNFPLAPTERSITQLYLGVTGQDWPADQLDPVAWRVRIQRGDEVLAEKKSFLWEMP